MVNVRRRPRGSLDRALYIQTNYTISRANKHLLESFSNSLGITSAEGLDHVLSQLGEEIKASHDGLPPWIDRNQIPEELPYNRSA